MLLKHHEKTQELEYRQQKSVHNLREEQITKQHATELQNQKDYMERAEKELIRKHAVELKQQPKSLKVRTFIQSTDINEIFILSLRFISKKNYKFVNNFVKHVKRRLDNIRL